MFVSSEVSNKKEMKMNDNERKKNNPLSIHSSNTDDNTLFPSLLANPLKKPLIKGILELADGSMNEGYSFGDVICMSGEVVFTTGMVGYPEVFTDPSYRGQILVLTYPLIGNYGVPSNSILDKFGLPKYFESSKVQISGLIVSEYSFQYSHWNAVKSLSKWLTENHIPALYGIDTRKLTKKIREHGSILGKIEFPSKLPSLGQLSDPNKRNLVAEVSCTTINVYNKGGSPKILAYDCGMKYNIIRCLASRKIELTVVPYNYDLEKNEKNIEYDGIFISNGPGDPTSLYETTIKSIKFALNEMNPKPIFGICLGNQILALAAGAKTYKMKYGNRGMNQPCIDMRTTRCYITSQNHGYAVDSTSLPKNWQTFFINANDYTNEGIIHEYKPFCSVQFHPEACGGPLDTEFLFDNFLEKVQGKPAKIVLLDTSLYNRPLVKKVLLLGSGGLSIGQAGEFDYSGSQAIKALKEEGVEIILINPNIATVQTSKGMADKVYFIPVLYNTVLEVIKQEKPDGILVSMGGQTALNVGIELYEKGDLSKHNVKVLGTQISSIIATEDREKFASILAEIGESIALSKPANTIKEAIEAAKEIGYPVLVRAAYALGGLGSGFASNEAELIILAKKTLREDGIIDPKKQILIDQDLRGWKEVEYEVVRDWKDNCVTVCNMENFDPLGIHTGDSIVVAPSQTLSNQEYYMLRKAAQKVIRRLKIVGECNIQYALDPHSSRYCIIEVNARLSRSSALASKATGYPLAYVATKLSLGLDLVSIKNNITEKTTSCFEPSLDYCVVKMPRWDLKKFNRVSTDLGSYMLSVGEVMAIGRNFEECIQKAVRMVNPIMDGLDGKPVDFTTDDVQIKEYLSRPTDERLFYVIQAFDNGNYTVQDVHDLTGIDKWFLSKLKNISSLRKEMGKVTLAEMTKDMLLTLKKNGFSDKQIARGLLTDNNNSHTITEMDIRNKRKQENVLPVVKQIDTLAAEFPAFTNYLYMTYNGTENDLPPERLRIDRRITPDFCGLAAYPVVASEPFLMNENTQETDNKIDDLSSKRSSRLSISRLQDISSTSNISDDDNNNNVDASELGVIVLGCGAYCIGSSVEFDWCAVSAVRTIRSNNIKDGISNTGNTGKKFRAIVINYNPETVSTDYDESDRLFFEELSLERILDIYERESAYGVIISVGGQIPNNLAMKLYQNSVNILGTHPLSIDQCEDRNKFSKLLDDLSIDQPEWSIVTTIPLAEKFAEKVQYPVLIRPSYVLSGAGMIVASNSEQLNEYLNSSAVVSSTSICISKFILHAKEIEFDGVAKSGKIINYAISEHVENAGVHSGDATLLLPAQRLYVKTIKQVKQIASKISKALNITGPFNIQLMARDNDVKVIECNLRASRTFPFISKTFDLNFIQLATRAMLDLPVQSVPIALVDIDYVAVKAPQFSFTRLNGADPTLGVEMASTGEVACFGTDMHEAYLKALLAAGFKLPRKNKNILISIGGDDYIKREFLEYAKILKNMGFFLFCTPGTAQYFKKYGDIDTTILYKGDNDCNNALDFISSGKIELLINVPEGSTKEEISYGYRMRRAAIDCRVSLLTNIKCAILLTLSLSKVKYLEINSIEQYYAMPTVGWREGTKLLSRKMAFH